MRALALSPPSSLSFLCTHTHALRSAYRSLRLCNPPFSSPPPLQLFNRRIHMADLVFLYPDTSEGELPRPQSKRGEKKIRAKQKHGLDSNNRQGQKWWWWFGGTPMGLLIDGSPVGKRWAHRACVCWQLHQEARCTTAKVARLTIINRSMVTLMGMWLKH